MSASEYVVHALKAVQPSDESSSYWIPKLFQELKKGRARFGWGSFDLRRLRDKIERSGGLDKLSSNERAVWNHASFLLDVAASDYLVYVNMPDYGTCTLVSVVTGGYTYSDVWDPDQEDDFRHVLPCKFIATFDRNDPVVAPNLSVRLKLQGAHYRVYADAEFAELLSSLADHKKGRTAEERLHVDIAAALASTSDSVRRNFPRKDLERLVEAMYKNVPNVKNVRKGVVVPFDFHRGFNAQADGVNLWAWRRRKLTPRNRRQGTAETLPE